MYNNRCVIERDEQTDLAEVHELPSAPSGQRLGKQDEDTARPRPGFTALEEVVLKSGATGIEDYVYDDAKQDLAALAGEDADGSRLRKISRRLTMEDHYLQVLKARQGQHIEAGDYVVAGQLDKLITAATKRLTALLKSHREEIRGLSPRSVVMIAEAERVELKDGGQG